MAYEWSKDEYDRLPMFVQDVRALLEKWFKAMEDGTVDSWLPDPLYQPKITAEMVQKVIAHIDERFDFELGAWANQELAGGYGVGPEFGKRLTPGQQLALCQQIHALKVKDQQRPPAYNPYAGFDVS